MKIKGQHREGLFKWEWLVKTGTSHLNTYVFVQGTVERVKHYIWSLLLHHGPKLACLDCHFIRALGMKSSLNKYFQWINEQDSMTLNCQMSIPHLLIREYLPFLYKIPLPQSIQINRLFQSTMSSKILWYLMVNVH